MNNLVSSPDSHKPYRHDEIDKKDLISELPDSLLHHILSFLSTRDAIRTSLLARRWKFLWTYLSDFEIEVDHQKPMNYLINKVDTILEKAKFIKRFCLLAFHNGKPVDVCKVYCWTLTLLQKHQIQELELSLYLRSPFLLSNYLSVLKSLNVMDLELPCILYVPNCVHFPCLKTLKLQFMTFGDETSVQQLFSGCPVLQMLGLYNCDWKNVENVSIKIPSLTTLIVEDARFDDNFVNCRVTIDAVNLRSFNCQHDLVVEFILVGLTSLADAYIDVSNDKSYLKQYTIPRAVKLFSGILHVKSLILSKYALETLSRAENLLSRLPTFHNLTHLGVDREMSDFNGRTLMDILEKSPKLEVLDIVEGFDPDFCSNGVVWTLCPVPQCIKYSLKLVSITDFWGRVAEMQLLIFLLKNATILTEIEIFCGENLSADLNKQAEIRKQLQVTRKGLPNCAIEFR